MVYTAPWFFLKKDLLATEKAVLQCCWMSSYLIKIQLCLSMQMYSLYYDFFIIMIFLSTLFLALLCVEHAKYLIKPLIQNHK